MSKCPTNDTLERFAYDFAETHELAELRAHTAECAACARRIEEFKAEGAALATAAKQVKMPRLTRPRHFPWVKLAVAATLLLGVGVVALQSSMMSRWPAEEEAVVTSPARKPVSPSGYRGPYYKADEDTRGTTASARLDLIEGVTALPTRPVPDPKTTPEMARPGDLPVAKNPRDMHFKSHGTNPFLKTADTQQSTFAMDVDTASYTLLRRYLTEGNLPPADAIRVEECINFFRYADAAPVDETFAIHLEAVPSRFGKGLHLLRVAIKAKEITKKERLPFTLTLVIDTSGSMQERNKMRLVKESLELLVGELREGDLVSIVKYSDEASVLLEPTGDAKKILGAIATLQPENSTNAEAGLRLGYDLAVKNFREKTTNRVILCSDGVANVGLTGAGSIADVLTTQRKKGIVLTCVGYGIENYNDALLEQLANKADGSYCYVDTVKEARRLFVDRLTGTMQTVAMDAKVQVEFDPAVVTKHRLVGYENRMMANQDFRNDKKDAGEVGAGHNVVALYEVELAEAKAADRLVKVSVRYREPDSKEVVEHTRGLARGAVKGAFKEATLQFQLSAVVAEFAEILRKSPHAAGNTLEGVLADATRLAQDLDQPEDVKELVELVKKAAALRK